MKVRIGNLDDGKVVFTAENNEDKKILTILMNSRLLNRIYTRPGNCDISGAMVTLQCYENPKWIQLKK